MVLGRGDFKKLYKEVDLAGRGTVRLQSLSQKDFMSVQKLISKNGKPESDEEAEAYGAGVLFPAFAAIAIVDDGGQRVFDGPEDAEIQNLSLSELVTLGQAITEFWGLDSMKVVTPKNSDAASTE